MERLWEKVDIQGPDDCWPWKGGHTKDGYGIITYRKAVNVPGWKSVPTAILEDKLGRKLLPNHVPDHLCRNHPCSNPKHLEEVTYKVNAERGIGHGHETHCPQGHPYDEKNTGRGSRGERKCRACDSIRHRAKRADRAERGLDI